jgi:glycosyltransferase domain-containing protein
MSTEPWISVRHAALSDLTLVIVTYNRPEMVQRLLGYLQRQAPEVTLLLLDHGDDASQLSNAAAIASFLPAVRHLRLPDDATSADLMIRLGTEIATTYSALCTDDDIPVIDGIIDAVSMLIAHPDMVCAQGYALSLTETDTAIYFGPIEDYVPSYDNAAPLNRLFDLMRRYQPIPYAIYRTEMLFWVYGECARANISNLIFAEIFHAALVCSRGTVGRSPSISLWRRAAGSYVDRRKVHPFHQLIDSPAMLGSSYLEFRERLVPYYLDDANVNGNEAGVRRLIDLVFMQFLVRHINPGELEVMIMHLLDDPAHDYFPGLTARKQDFDARDFMPLTDFKESDVFVDNEVFKEAEQVTLALAQGKFDFGREKKISTEMLVGAIESALDYRHMPTPAP